MRIGQVNQENYKDYLKLLGVKTPKSLENFLGKDKAKPGGLDQFGQKVGDYSFEAQSARAVAAGIATEGMIIREGDDSWKKIVDVPDWVKDKLIGHAREAFIINGNGTITAEQYDNMGRDWNYILTIPPQERLSADWTMTKIYQAEARRITDYLRSQIPGWQPGQAFDTRILTESNFGLGKEHFDVRA